MIFASLVAVLGLNLSVSACQGSSPAVKMNDPENKYFKPDKNRDYLQDTWRPKVFPVPVNPIQGSFPNGISSNKVKVYFRDTIAPVLPSQSGLNTTFRNGRDMVSKRLENYRNSNMGAFRFPAGSGSNLYFWDGKIPPKFLTDVNPIDGTNENALKISDFITLIHSSL